MTRAGRDWPSRAGCSGRPRRHALPTTAHPSSSLQRRDARLPGSQGAPCVDTGNFSGHSAPPGIPSSLVLGRGLRRAPLLSRSAELAVASHPGKVAVPPPLYSRDLRRPGAVQQLAEFLSSLSQKLQRKLPTSLALQRPGLRQRPPARRPQLLPRRPAFVLLPHPALQPGQNSRIPLRAWGAAGAGPPGPGPSWLCPGVPARGWALALGAPRSWLPPP